MLDGPFISHTYILMLLVGLGFSEEGRRSTSPLSGEVLEVAFYDPRGTAADSAEVEREVSRILGEAGVEVRFVDPLAHLETSDREALICATLLDKDPSELKLRADVMGVVARNASGPRSVYIFHPTVLRAINVDAGAPVLRTRYGRTMTSRAIARVLVHEIVHSLAPSLPHAESGIMASRLKERPLTLPLVPLDEDARRAISRTLEARTPARAGVSHP